jgi:hypothetical protein
LGECLVIAAYEGYADTARVTVDRGSVYFSSGGGDTVFIGENIEIRLPLFSVEQLDTIMEISLLERSERPSQISLAGPAVIFTPKQDSIQWIFDNSVVLRFQIDTLKLNKEDLARVQVYRKNPVEGSPWILVSSVQEGGNWLSFTADTLGAYFIGLDTQVPALEWINSETKANLKASFSVSFTVEDNIANPEIRLRVRAGGSEGSNVFPLDYTEGLMTAIIPDYMVTDRGLWYSIEVWDGANLISDTIDIKVNLDTGMSLPSEIEFPEGWYNMISLPLDPVIKRVDTLFYHEWGPHDPERWRLFSYESKFIELYADSKIMPGRSYWLRTRGFSPRIALSNVTTLPVSRAYKVGLGPGWNCISNPFSFNVDAGSVTLDNGTGIQHLYLYENSVWLTRDMIPFLQPWKGYLIWNGPSDSPLTDSLAITPLEYMDPLLADVRRKHSSSAGPFRIRVSAEGGKNRDGLAVLGFGFPGSGNGRDARDLVKPLLFDKPLELNVLVSWDQKTPYLSDIRGDPGEGQSWHLMVRNKTGRSARLEFKGLDELPPGFVAVLLDKSGAKPVTLKGAVYEYATENREMQRFEVLAGTYEYVGNRVSELSTRNPGFTLEQNFPNPFRKATSIRYSVPFTEGGSLPVLLEVYDLQGRRVYELVRESRSPGWYDETWMGRDSEGTELPAGAYICRLRVGTEFYAKIKMLLLR